jgi:hypothetical protein
MHTEHTLSRQKRLLGAIGGTNIQREDRGRRADLLAYKPQAQESRDCPSVCGDMNARISLELTQGRIRRRNSTPPNQCPVAKRASSQSTKRLGNWYQISSVARTAIWQTERTQTSIFLKGLAKRSVGNEKVRKWWEFTSRIGLGGDAKSSFMARAFHRKWANSRE